MGRSSQGSTLKRSASVYLTEKVGSKITGVFQQTTNSKTYPGQVSYLISVEETDASTRLYDAATKKENEVDVAVGESVFLKGATLLNNAIKELGVKKGDRITVTYLGKGEASPGRRPPYRFNVEVH